MELSQSQRKNNIYYKERGLCYDKPDTRWRKWSRKGGVGGEKAIKKTQFYSLEVSRWVGINFARNSRAPTYRIRLQLETNLEEGLPTSIFYFFVVVCFAFSRGEKHTDRLSESETGPSGPR